MKKKGLQNAFADIDADFSTTTFATEEQAPEQKAPTPKKHEPTQTKRIQAPKKTSKKALVDVSSAPTLFLTPKKRTRLEITAFKLLALFKESLGDKSEGRFFLNALPSLLDCSQNTARNAIKYLCDEGYFDIFPVSASAHKLGMCVHKLAKADEYNEADS